MYTYPNYLCHHGVKGMKWGVRKSRRYSGGVTKNGKPISNRKAKRTLIKNNYNPGKNFQEVYKQKEQEFNKSKANKIYQKSIVDHKGLTEKEIAQVYKEVDRIHKKYLNDTRSAILKDLGYDDTKAGRDFVGKIANENANKIRSNYKSWT